VVIGKWQFHLNLNKALEEDSSKDSGFAKAIIKGLATTVDEVVKQEEITFHFKKDHTLIVLQKENNTKEEDHKTWAIKNNKLILSSNKATDSKPNQWLLDNKKLIAINKEGKAQQSVYLEKLD
jgi:hypothetical protein